MRRISMDGASMGARGLWLSLAWLSASTALGCGRRGAPASQDPGAERPAPPAQLAPPAQPEEPAAPLQESRVERDGLSIAFALRPLDRGQQGGDRPRGGAGRGGGGLRRHGRVHHHRRVHGRRSVASRRSAGCRAAPGRTAPPRRASPAARPRQPRQRCARGEPRQRRARGEPRQRRDRRRAGRGGVPGGRSRASWRASCPCAPRST